MPTWEYPCPCTTTGKATLRVRLDSFKAFKVVQKHVRQSQEPWGDWFDAATIRELRAWGSPEVGNAGDCLARFEEGFARQVEQSARHRLAIRFYRRPILRESPQWLEHWLLVLPVGALTTLRRTGRDVAVQSCYFHKHACREQTAARRCRATIVRFVRRYARVEDGQVMAPDRNQEFHVDTELGREVHSGVQFCAPENWGFSAATGRWSPDEIPSFPDTGSPRPRGEPYRLDAPYTSVHEV